MWKILHGAAQFRRDQINEYLDRKVVTVGWYPGFKQIEDFHGIRIGDPFYLCHASEVLLIGRMKSELVRSHLKKNWWERSYKEIKRLSPGRKYEGSREIWTPSGYSTCVPIPDDDLKEFEKRILRPFFKMRLSDLGPSLQCDSVAAAMNRGGKSEFGSTGAAEKKIQASIWRRRGQPRFRRHLMGLYEGKCAISECNAPEALEAAHIIPYGKKAVYQLQNGLLLRADLHTLFDLHLITIEPRSMKVRVDQSLMRTDYRKFDGKPLRRPKLSEFRPKKDALKQHREAAQL